MALAEVSFFSQALRHNVKIQAYIPTDRNMLLQQESVYSCDKAKTLYLLHGIGGDCNDYITYSNITRLYNFIYEYLASGTGVSRHLQ